MARRYAGRLRQIASYLAGVVLGFVMGAGPVVAQAQPLPDFIAQALPQAVALARQAALVQAPPQSRIQVEPGQLDPRLNLAACGRVETFLWPGVAPWGRTRIGLRCTDGQARWRISLPMTVQVWAPGVTVRADLPAGTRLAAEHLGQAAIDWAAGPGAAVAHLDKVLGRVLARPVAGGQALREDDMQTRQWFARGETVRVQVSGPGFSAVADGEALSPGLDGQLVRVRMASDGTDNDGKSTSRVVVGTAVGDRRVEVKL